MERFWPRPHAPTPLRPIGRSGQFIPITAMVTFTAVVFLVAVVNVYKVARAKLKVQNLADAVALNIASQMASSMNKAADMNEYMNHIVGQAPGVAASKPGEIPNCADANPGLPPISCAENPNKDSGLHLFPLKGDAASYAGLVQTVNQAQQLFIDAYNNFIGAGAGSNSTIGSNSSLNSILMGDIPELREPGTSVFVWNNQGGKAKPLAVQAAKANMNGVQSGQLNTSGMQPLKFKIHDIRVTFKTVIPILNTPGPLVSKTLGELLASDKQAVVPVGYMEPDPAQPLIKVGAGNATKTRIGAGALVIRMIQVPPLGSITVQAQAQAFVVDQSGSTGDLQPDPLYGGFSRPVFKPTYWVKLAGSQ